MKNGGAKGRKSRQRKKRKGAHESGRLSSRSSEIDPAEITGARESNWWKEKEIVRDIHPKDVSQYKDDFKKRVGKMFKGVELSTGIRQDSKAASLLKEKMANAAGISTSGKLPD